MLEQITPPKFAWGLWVGVVFGVTMGSVLSGIFGGRITDFPSALTTAGIAAIASAISSGLMLVIVFSIKRKHAKGHVIDKLKL